MAPTFFNQQEAASYLRESHGLEITPAELSVLCKFHLGPAHGTKGHMKVITQESLDKFAKEQRNAAERRTSA